MHLAHNKTPSSDITTSWPNHGKVIISTVENISSSALNKKSLLYCQCLVHSRNTLVVAQLA